MNAELVVQTREQSGKSAAKRIRREEMVPAVLYGPKTEPVSLSVEAKTLEKLLREIGEETKLIKISMADGQDKQVLIREVQVHPFRRQFLHVDFYEVPMDQPITVEVPLEMKGESVGVRKGGTLNLIRRTLPVRCLPGEIPERVYIDVTNLDLGGLIRVSDLQGKGYEITEDGNATVVNMLSPEGAKEGGEEA